MSQVAGDVLSCGVPSLYDNFTGEPNDLLYPVLFSFLDLPALNSTRAGYFTRIVYALLNRRTAQVSPMPPLLCAPCGCWPPCAWRQK